MKNKIFNIIVYAMLGWSIVSAGYMALPVEYQAMIPDFNWLTALISGGSTMMLGIGGLAVKQFMASAKTVADTKYTELGTKFLELTDKYKTLEGKYSEVVKSLQETMLSIQRNSTLLEAELKTKLSNPLIDAKAEELINQVLYGVTADEQQG